MKNPFKRSYSEEHIQFFDFLSNAYLFRSLKFEELDHIAPMLFLRTYQRQEVVFFRGDPSAALYIIKSGSVSLNIDIGGKFEILDTHKAGDLFGENAILKETHRLASAIVESEEAKIYVLPKSGIIDLFEKRTDIKAKVMENLGEAFNQYMVEIFRHYKSSYGFFELSGSLQS